MDDIGGCLGCEMEANMKERSFERIKQEAEDYAKKNQVDLVIYMEGQDWKYYSAEHAASIGIHHSRYVVRFNSLFKP